MKGLVWLILPLLVLTGGCCRPPVQSQSTEKDSIIVIDRERVVKVPGERVELLIPIECDSITNQPKPIAPYTRKGEYGTTIIRVDSGRIHLTEVREAYETRIKELEKKLSSTKKERIEIPVPYVPVRYKYAAWLAGILLVWVLLPLLWKAFKLLVLKRL